MWSLSGVFIVEYAFGLETKAEVSATRFDACEGGFYIAYLGKMRKSYTLPG